MQHLGRGFLLALTASFLLAVPAFAQDQPSLGDVARQARQKKQQTKDAQATDAQGKPAQSAKPSKVITEDEMPDGAAPEMKSPDPSKSHADADSPAAASAGKLSADEWRSKIQAAKSAVDTLQGNMDELNKSIQFAPGNCVSGCVEWNEHQKQKQQEVEQMKGQLETAKTKLQEMQDAARQQGYGSSVYEP
jgi:hypothetical protein